jgi:hypothetical protein
MRVGLTLSGDLLNDDGAKFEAQLGVTGIPFASPSIRGTLPEVCLPGGGDPDEPIPDGMVWNMRYRDGRTPRLPCACLTRSSGIGSPFPLQPGYGRSAA